MKELLTALIQEWRDEGKRLQTGPPGPWNPIRASQLTDCAGELEVLAARLQAPEPPTVLEGVSAHDHGNCQLCDWIEAQLAAVEAELHQREVERKVMSQSIADQANEFEKVCAELDGLRASLRTLRDEMQRNGQYIGNMPCAAAARWAERLASLIDAGEQK